MSHPETSADAPPVPDTPEMPIETGDAREPAHADQVFEAAATLGDAIELEPEAAAGGNGPVAPDLAVETARAFAEARDRLQEATVSGLEHGQGMLGQFGMGHDQFAASFGSGLVQAPAHVAAFNAKAMEAWQSNAGALMAHWQNLLHVSSWSEMIALNAEHTRKQIEALTAQARELSSLAGQMAQGASEPPPSVKHDDGS